MVKTIDILQGWFRHQTETPEAREVAGIEWFKAGIKLAELEAKQVEVDEVDDSTAEFSED